MKKQIELKNDQIKLHDYRKMITQVTIYFIFYSTKNQKNLFKFQFIPSSFKFQKEQFGEIINEETTEQTFSNTTNDSLDAISETEESSRLEEYPYSTFAYSNLLTKRKKRETKTNYTTISAVKSCEKYEVGHFKYLGRIAFKDDTILICDYEDESIKELNITLGSCKIIKEESKIQKPWSLHVNSRNETYVGDLLENKILILNNEMDLIDEFEVSMKPSNISYDLNENKVYVAHWLMNKISVFDENKNCVEMDIDSPLSMELSNKNIYIVSYTEFEKNPDPNELLSITKGSNCIYVFRKDKSLRFVKAMRCSTWLAPLGLYLDSVGNITTTAYKLDEGIVSNNRFLFVIDQIGRFIREIELDGINECNSLAFNRNKLVVTYDKSFKYIEFE
jgi:hypothetical protein